MSAPLSDGVRTLWLHAYPTGSWAITATGETVRMSFEFCTGRLDRSRVYPAGLSEAMRDAEEAAREILGTELPDPGKPLTSNPEA